MLVGGQRYLLETLHVAAATVFDFLQVGVLYPDTTLQQPMTTNIYNSRV